MDIIYAKKFRFPNKSANVIQALNMLAAFSTCSRRVSSFFSFGENLDSPDRFLRAYYGLDTDKFGDYTVAPRALRGLRYPLWLARRVMLADKESLVYAREETEVRRAGLFRHLHMPALPLFYEVHKFDFDAQGDFPQQEQRREDIRRLLSIVSGVVFVDQSLQEQAVAQFGLKVPAHIAPGGVDIDMFGRRKSVLPSSEVTVGYFGKISEEKGAMLLAAALRFLPEQYRLRFVGDARGKDKECLLTAAGDAAPRIELRDKVSQAHLAEAMEGVHISVIPVVNEGQFFSPLKRAESLAMGLPLVCTPIPHLKRVLQEGKHALFAEDITPEALAKAICTLGSSPALMESMQRENRAYAEQFSWQKRAQGIVDFMREVMKK